MTFKFFHIIEFCRDFSARDSIGRRDSIKEKRRDSVKAWDESS